MRQKREMTTKKKTNVQTLGVKLSGVLLTSVSGETEFLHSKAALLG